jgi:hypothetical protein
MVSQTIGAIGPSQAVPCLYFVCPCAGNYLHWPDWVTSQVSQPQVNQTITIPVLLFGLKSAL